VPEPETVSLLLAGLRVVGIMARRCTKIAVVQGTKPAVHPATLLRGNPETLGKYVKNWPVAHVDHALIAI
jgi:hypothetical protein